MVIIKALAWALSLAAVVTWLVAPGTLGRFDPL